MAQPDGFGGKRTCGDLWCLKDDPTRNFARELFNGLHQHPGLYHRCPDFDIALKPLQCLLVTYQPNFPIIHPALNFIRVILMYLNGHFDKVKILIYQASTPGSEIPLQLAPADASGLAIDFKALSIRVCSLCHILG